jgi:hypothetical protein
MSSEAHRRQTEHVRVPTPTRSHLHDGMPSATTTRQRRIWYLLLLCAAVAAAAFLVFLTFLALHPR